MDSETKVMDSDTPTTVTLNEEDATAIVTVLITWIIKKVESFGLTHVFLRFSDTEKMGGSDENRHGVIGPMNLQGGLRGPTRRALSAINKNIIGAPVYPCAVNKRPFTEKNGICNKKIPTVPLHRPITRKFAAQLAENNPQIHKEETKKSDSISNEALDRIIIDVEDEDGDFNEPMFVQDTEAMLEEIDRMEGIEMEESNDIDIDEEEFVMETIF